MILDQWNEDLEGTKPMIGGIMFLVGLGLVGGAWFRNSYSQIIGNIIPDWGYKVMYVAGFGLMVYGMRFLMDYNFAAEEFRAPINKPIYRKKRPSPSLSATSVAVGTRKRGGDGKMYVCKSYKRGKKRVKRWVRA